MQDLDNCLTLGNHRASSDCPHLNGNFVAINFETANGRRSSVCSVGIVVVRGGEIVDKFYSLIQPTPQLLHILDNRSSRSHSPGHRRAAHIS